MNKIPALLMTVLCMSLVASCGSGGEDRSILDDVKIEGIGAEVTVDEAGKLIVVHPFPDTPAAAAGLKKNDRILTIDGKKATGLTLKDAVGMIRGPVGTSVTLTVERNGKSIGALKVKRENFVLEEVEIEEDEE